MHQQPVQTIHEHHALRLYIMPFYRRIGYVSLRDQRTVMNANAVMRFFVNVPDACREKLFYHGTFHCKVRAKFTQQLAYIDCLQLC
jgi:hypothetical protein